MVRASRWQYSRKCRLADPRNEDFRQSVAAVSTFVCQMMIKTGNAAEAIELLNQSLRTFETSFAASPTDEIGSFSYSQRAGTLGARPCHVSCRWQDIRSEAFGELARLLPGLVVRLNTKLLDRSTGTCRPKSSTAPHRINVDYLTLIG